MYPYPVLSVSPYPNSALSAGQYAIIAVVAVLSLSAWLVLVFAAGRTAAPRPGRRCCRSSRMHRNKSASNRNVRPPDVLASVGHDPVDGEVQPDWATSVSISPLLAVPSVMPHRRARAASPSSSVVSQLTRKLSGAVTSR